MNETRPPDPQSPPAAADVPFGSLLVTQIPRLRRYARSLTRQPAAADDLVQDVLELAWAKQSGFRAGTDLRAWLFTIMHNRFVSQVRSAPPPMTTLDDAPEPGVAPQAETRAQLHDLQRAFDALGAEHRAVLMLVAVEELSYEEAARTLSIPIGTVMSRLARARERLRTLLDRDALSTVVPFKRNR